MSKKDETPTKPGNRKKTPKALSKKELIALKLREKILDLREGGASIRAISEHLTASGEKGCSPTMVFTHLQTALQDLINSQRLRIQHVQQLELRKLDRAELAIFPLLLAKGLKAKEVDELSKAMERIWKRRDALLGLHKPIVHEHTGKEGGPIQMATRVIMPAAEETAENFLDQDNSDQE